ncbi:MAG: hypothetical protein FWD31_03665 [Planctomycetaceae bacterium]|nr:hypothetical protein [Planctomycetaceae bacterium]
MKDREWPEVLSPFVVTIIEFGEYAMKSTAVPVIVVLLTLLSCLGSPFVQGKEPIGLFDLRYTLRSDLADPEKLNEAWDHVHTAAVLQGVVNRNEPRLFYFFVETGRQCIDEYWWEMYRKPGKWLAERETTTYDNIVDLVTAYRDDVDGVVVYDPNVPSTSNVASAVAGIENLVAVRYDTAPHSLYSQIVLGGPQLPVKLRLLNEDGSPLFTGQGKIPGTDRDSTGSIKCDPYIWYIEHYMKAGRCNPEFGAYYIDQKWREKPTATVRNHHTLTNHDFFVAQKAFFFDLSPWGDEPATDDPTQAVGTDLATLKEFLLTAYKLNDGKKITYIGGFPAWIYKYTKHAGGSHDDVPTEWEFSRIISAYNAFKDADAIGYGALANASFWQHYPLKEHYAQPWVTHEQLKQRGYLTDDGRVHFDGRHFVIFYVGDYDAASWVSQTTPSIWDNPDRGKVPMMWCISPVLEKRVPMALEYQRETATPNDYFAAADNGAGYLMPGMLQEPRDISGLPCGLDAWAEHCKPYYKRWDMTVTGFVIDGYAPGLDAQGLDCYASFSPNGIVPQKVPLAMLHGNMPVLRSDYDLVSNNPKEAANVAMQRIRLREGEIRFHWFRHILKSPTWQVGVIEEMQALDPKIELLDAPTFFELLRIDLQNHPR